MISSWKRKLRMGWWVAAKGLSLGAGTVGTHCVTLLEYVTGDRSAQAPFSFKLYFEEALLANWR